MQLYYGKVNWEPMFFYVVASKEALYYIGSKNTPLDEATHWVKKRYPKAILTEDTDVIAPYEAQLREYFNGNRQIFDTNMTLKGTEFQEAVWQALQTIPYGETRSYADIATQIKRPKAVRAVGSAIGANPIPIIVPCHRVIAKNGKLSGFRGGVDLKQRLLKREGIQL